MADNTPITDADTVVESIATDELSTLNGTDVSASSPRIKAQRTKVGFGSDGTFRDADSTHGLPVEVVAALPAGDNNIGNVDIVTLPTLPAGTNAIGTVGVTSLPALPAGTNVIGHVAVDSLPAVDTELTTADLDTGAGTDTRAVVGVALAASGGAQLVGSANPLPISDNGSSITVDGSVSVASALPAGTNNIGDVDVLTLPALPAGTNNIGDVDVLTIPAAARTTDSISAAVATDAIMSSTTVLTPKFAKISTSASGATTVVAAVASKKLRVLRWDLVASAAVNVKWQSHVTPTDLSGLYEFAANGGISAPFCPVGHFETVSGEALDINLSGAVTVGGTLTYVEV